MMLIAGSDYSDSALDSLIDVALLGAAREAARVGRKWCPDCTIPLLARRLVSETLLMVDSLALTDPTQVPIVLQICGELSVREFWMNDCGNAK
jgi:predicted RNA-binding protein with PUA domain